MRVLILCVCFTYAVAASLGVSNNNQAETTTAASRVNTPKEKYNTSKMEEELVAGSNNKVEEIKNNIDKDGTDKEYLELIRNAFDLTVEVSENDLNKIRKRLEEEKKSLERKANSAIPAVAASVPPVDKTE